MKQEMPRIPNSNYNLFKKGSKLILSAATFGVVAAGSFQGVNYVVNNYNKENTTVQSTNVVKSLKIVCLVLYRLPMFPYRMYKIISVCMEITQEAIHLPNKKVQVLVVVLLSINRMVKSIF